MALLGAALRTGDDRLSNSDVRAYGLWQFLGRKPAHTRELTRIWWPLFWAALRDRGSGEVDRRPGRRLLYRMLISGIR